MTTARAYAASSLNAPLAPWSLERRGVGPGDVRIDILFCGICHSDVHAARNEWGGTTYPLVPGHEIVGRVVETGSSVSRFRPGDLVGVGCMVDACLTCSSCKAGEEQLCETGFTGTYGGTDKISGGVTYGGYSDHIVVKENFVLRIPAGLDPAGAAPLLCAGITTYSPLRHWKAGPGKKVGIVGLGGLGHMGIKLAHAMGAEVVLFTTSPSKVADGARLGADAAVLWKDPAQLAPHAGTFDLILDTVAASHDLDVFLQLLRRDGTLVLLGAPDQPHPSPNVFNLLLRRRSLAGSLIGGIAETQEMLDFCAQHGLLSDIETVPVQKVNEAFDRTVKGDVKYRFVIDMKTLG
ncbi:putative zinc-type alcohol dehydrogenase-like protein [Panacagrimonas perspica]|uniref:Putative zinc-type alcohol dehydrogenase-like protein n=1 Tax=Panacagrimonas perspica TaxID=381431 RepID=A0A4S3JZD7_9GAMM|nr:NAD(P)-dependent alcohol dehydrogenase [Panacagrimonas perspica]TDU28490.1 putative zinc-type alcohol dehydrogenase-like protein [Panacagrimonas perspica]THD00888.1 hydroxyacid dehydrogenase [Panacagrimonas perspica]